MNPGPQPSETDAALPRHVVRLEAELSRERARAEQLTKERDQVTKERDQLRAAYEKLRLELSLLKHRLFVAKAERVDTAQLELEFADKLALLDKLTGKLEAEPEQPEPASPPPPPPPRPQRPKPKGRRDLRDALLPEERIELTDPTMEAKVEAGLAERIGFEESCKLAFQRGGHRRLIIARVKYLVLGTPPQAQPPTLVTAPLPTQNETLPPTLVTAPLPTQTLPSTLVTASLPTQTLPSTLVTAPLPTQILSRCLAAPSLLAHIVVDKYCDGLPLFRIQDRFARDGVCIDRGTMCRWLEDLGATCGATVIEAARKEALSTAFCLATDATGVLVQPIPTGKRQPCRRGHYFVQIADQDHVFFEYTPNETQKTVGELFRGFSGYVQADAKNVYDLLFLSPQERKRRLLADMEDDGCLRKEVGCWCHARRKFWESAMANCAVAREALVRIGRLFDWEQQWKGRPHDQIKQLRQQFLRPHLDAFFAWAAPAYETVRDQRGLLRSALGYLVRQQGALLRFLEDGRLLLDNNRSERALRRIATGRKAWLFVGSDDHAAAAGHLLSLVASARLHGLDPEAYLRDLFRVLGHWPRHRYLELAPKYWARTRARLDPAHLQAEFGPLTIPPPLPASAEEQTPSH